jgi:hypothetical protein
MSIQVVAYPFPRIRELPPASQEAEASSPPAMCEEFESLAARWRENEAGNRFHVVECLDGITAGTKSFALHSSPRIL